MHGLKLAPGMVLRLWLEAQSSEVPLPVLRATDTSFLVSAPPALRYYPGMRLVCRYYADGGIWKFTVAVLSTVPERESVTLSLTQPAAVEHTQKRNDVRVDVTLPVTLTVDLLKVEGKTLDLSAGGVRMSFLRSTGHELPNGAEGVLELPVEEKGPAMKLAVRVVRVIQREKVIELGLNFLRIREAERACIVRRVFAEQRRRIR